MEDPKARPLVTEDPLARLAASHGVETSYTDWRGEAARVSPDALVAVLAALGVDASTPASVKDALDQVFHENQTRLLPSVTVCGASPSGFAGPIDVGDVRILGDDILVGGGAEAAEVRLLLNSGEAVPLALGHSSGEAVLLAPGDSSAEAVLLAPGEPEEVLLAPGEPALMCGRDRLVPGASSVMLRYRVPADVPVGWHQITASTDGRSETAALLVTRIPALPTRRSWGFMTQLYSLRSRGSWGLGDLRDLADLAAWSGRDLGADFVLVNPLHAAESTPPIAASPYLPMSRRFTSPLYLRIEDIPEYSEPHLGLEVRQPAELSARNLTLEPLDRDAVWTAKARALEALFAVPLSEARRREYNRYLQREGDALTGYATWCALAEENGPDWRRWPTPLHDPASPQVAAARHRLAHRISFYTWLQWHLDQQLATAQHQAQAAGMSIGVVHDLAVGVHPGGSDAWLHQTIFAPCMSVGAPPDEFNQRGQDWGQPPWHPQRLADAAYLPYRDMLRSILRHAGGLRLDHALQVSRLWWVPEGGSPADGAYVHYDTKALLAALNFEADQAGAVIIGEDLGTVDPWVRDDLADHNILGTSLLWFERTETGRPKPARDWRPLSLATVGTHDLPPITGFLHADHVTLRERLGLLTRPPAEELADHHRQLQDWLTQLRTEGLLTTSTPTDPEIVEALHAFLARTPALLLGISLADAVGERRTQNQPGTTDEYPNWRVPLADVQTHPILLNDLPTNPHITQTTHPIRQALNPPTHP